MSKKNKAKRSKKKAKHSKTKQRLSNKKSIVQNKNGSIEINESEKVEQKTENQDNPEKIEHKNTPEKREEKRKHKRKHEKTKKKTEKKRKFKIKNKKILILGLILIVIIIGVIWYLINNVFIFKNDVQIEVGTKTEIDPRDFLRNYNLDGEIKLLTDTSNINFNKIAEYDIEVEFRGKKHKSKLNFVDTVAPVVEFKNVNAYIDYVFNADDFIVSKNDVTNMTVEIESQPELNEFKEYPIVIIVRDEGGNETRGNVVLNTSYIKTEFTLELGNVLTYEDLLVNPEVDRSILPQSELDRINSSPIGEYEIVTSYRGTQTITKIKIQDTTPPALVLKEATIYNDETSLDKSAFIESVTDASEFSTELKTQLPFGQVGNHDVEIEAKDVIGNTVTQTTKLNIVKDTKGPVFSGLGALSVNKNAAVDWNRGVTAKDAKDGICTFTVDTSGVQLGVSGTYTATYISTDKSGNTTKTGRKVTVNPDSTDVYNKAQEWLGKAGTDPISIKNYVASNIKYSTATNRSPIWGAWMGFTTLRGDCYVHAAVTNMLLQKAGYSTMIVNAVDNSHYWNLVNVGGTWKHLDSTPPRYSANGYMNDDERQATLGQKQWNRDAFPKSP